MLLKELHISDGKIINITSCLSGVKILFKDWKEQKWLITFYEVLSIQSMSVECEELSHLEITKEDNLKKDSMEYFLDENPDDYFCYSFYGVWINKALLKIIATDSHDVTKVN